MKANLIPFLTCGTLGWERAIRILSLFCWTFGGCMYAYITFEAIHWSSVFPSPNKMLYCVWLIHLSVRLLSLWMPMALLLVHWKVTKPLLLAVYILGAAVAILSSIVPAILMLDYDSKDYLRIEYFKLVNDQLEDGVFPSALTSSASFDSCCSWYGPTDFFEQFVHKDDLMKNEEFAEGLSKCYGGVITFKNGIPYSATDSTRITVRNGCSEVYANAAARIMNFIVLATVMVCILCPAFIGLLIYGYIHSKGTRAVTPAQDETPIQTDSQIPVSNDSEASVSNPDNNLLPE